MQIYQKFHNNNKNKKTQNWTLLTYEMQLHGSISSTHQEKLCLAFIWCFFLTLPDGMFISLRKYGCLPCKKKLYVMYVEGRKKEKNYIIE